MIGGQQMPGVPVAYRTRPSDVYGQPTRGVEVWPMTDKAKTFWGDTYAEASQKAAEAGYQLN